MAQLFTFALGTTGKAATTGYEFYDSGGSSLGARSVTGVTEFGTSGIYFRTMNLPAGAVAVVWDDTDTGKFAVDDAIGVKDANVVSNAGTAITSAAGIQEVKVASIAANAVNASALAADAVTEIQSGLALASDLAAVAGYLDTEIAAILADTNELQTDWANGGRLDLLVDAILADTNELQTDWVNGGRLDLLLDSVVAATAAAAIRTAVGLATANLDTQLSTIDTVVDAIKVVTDAESGANAIETGISKLQALRAILAAMVGVATGGSSTSIVLKNPAGDTTRATLAVDADGNRSASVLNL